MNTQTMHKLQIRLEPMITTTNHRHTYYLCERCAQEYGVPVNLNGDE